MAEKKKDVTESTEIVVVEVTEELLREKLYEVRGVKVMLDSESPGSINPMRARKQSGMHYWIR